MLEVHGLVAGYGKFQVLNGVDLAIQENEVVGVFGPNGAGKSTLLKALFGLVPVRAGAISFAGQNKTHFKPYQNAAAGLSLAPQDGNVFRELTVAENLLLGGSCIKDTQQVARKTEELLTVFPRLRERLRLPARVLSGGERQMLAVAIALMPSPRVVLLDEPSAGLAPIMVEGLFDTIQRVRRELQTAVLLVEQNVTEALTIATRVYVLRQGTIVYAGPSSEKDQIIRSLWGLESPVGESAH